MRWPNTSCCSASWPAQAQQMQASGGRPGCCMVLGPGLIPVLSPAVREVRVSHLACTASSARRGCQQRGQAGSPRGAGRPVTSEVISSPPQISVPCCNLTWSPIDLHTQKSSLTNFRSASRQPTYFHFGNLGDRRACRMPSEKIRWAAAHGCPKFPSACRL